MDETKMKWHAFSPDKISLRINPRICFKNHRIRGIRAAASIAAAAGDIPIRCPALTFFLIKMREPVASRQLMDRINLQTPEIRA
jgi:hypothetical protein